MRIYGFDRYRKLTSKRDKLREEYANKEMALGLKYNPVILKAKKKAKNFWHYFLYSVVLLIIVFLLLNKKLKQTESIIILSVIGLLAIGLLILTFIFRYKREVLINEFNEASNENQDLKNKIYQYNYELASLSIAIICYSEQCKKLNKITDIEERNRYFKELYYLYHDAIDSYYNHKATIEDFMDYYNKWENNFL